MTATASRPLVDEVLPGRARRFAGLVWVLARKGYRVRYRRTALGVVWALLQPVVHAAVIATVFSRLFGRVGVAHYPLFVLCGVLPWAFFTRSLSAATTSVVDNAGLLRKVAVSALVYPLAAIGAHLGAFGASLCVLLVSAAWLGTLSWATLLLPAAVALQLLVVLGPALWSSALVVKARDVRFAIESVLTVLFYATPVIYPAARLGPMGEALLRLNPLSGVLALYRSAIHGTAPDAVSVAVSVGFSVIAIATGLVVFRRRSVEFADLA